MRHPCCRRKSGGVRGGACILDDSNDTVVLRVLFRGTDTGGYVGRAPTGRAVEEWAVTIMHFEDGKIVREWIGADKLGLFIQLGVLDDPWPT